jgi:hypothetical protein
MPSPGMTAIRYSFMTFLQAKAVMVVGAGFKPALAPHALLARCYPDHPPNAQDHSRCTFLHQGRFETRPYKYRDLSAT